MARTVSTPYGCAAVCYVDGRHIEEDWDWDLFIDDLRTRAKKRWPSLDECNAWIDREDHAILENDYCFVGVSEYCGLVSVWLLPKELDTYYPDEASKENLAKRWVSSIENNFHKEFGEYRKVGTFSNGEAVYEKIN